MLDLILIAASAGVAAGNAATFRCVEPSGLTASPIVVEESSDLSNSPESHDPARKRSVDRTLRICRAISGCDHPMHCVPFIADDGLHFQRLGSFRFLPQVCGVERVRFLVQGWNDGAEVGETSRARGGVQILLPSTGDSIHSEFGTISVSEQSQVEIVRDSILVVADAIWAEDETRYAPHHFQIRAWNLNRPVIAGSPEISYVTRWRYRSLDDVDSLDVIRHEIPSIGLFLRRRESQ